MRSQRFRILLYNVGYETALDGSLRQYLLHFHRYFYTPRTVIRRVRKAIYGLLEREKPDVACFVELHGKKRSLPHPHAYSCSDVEAKYGLPRGLRRLPFFRDNCNGFMAREHLPFEKRYFRRGAKKLIYEIKLRDNLSLILVHFSVHRRVRRSQCRELQEFIGTRKKVILCGDFNIFRGPEELQALADACDLRIVNTPGDATFPSAHPRKALDLFLCPREMANARATVLERVHASDHLPVLLEMDVAA